MKLLSHSWKQEGSASLWRYTENERNYPGWHLSADSRGCASISTLLQLLAAEGPPASRVLALEPPSSAILAVPNNQGGAARYKALDKLRITFAKDSTQWIFSSQWDPAVLTFGYEWLSPLREGLDAISHGRGDYSIGNDRAGNLPLWFWWRPDAD